MSRSELLKNYTERRREAYEDAYSRLKTLKKGDLKLLENQLKLAAETHDCKPSEIYVFSIVNQLEVISRKLNEAEKCTEVLNALREE